MIRAVARQEFRLGYQPCIDAVTGRITHLEALLRWPTAPPGITIQGLVESLESNGLILQVGAWVVRQACRDLALLRREGHKRLSLSVNVSHAQLRDPELVSVIEDSLRLNRIPPARLKIEMTETMVPDIAKARHLVGRLFSLGVRTMIDDFGVGFSNFGLLREIPASSIKLDRSYTAEIFNSKRSAALTESILSMADRLSLEVIAEGVETEQQARWLTARNVRQLQGYYFSPAVDLGRMRQLMVDQPWLKPAAPLRARRV